MTLAQFIKENLDSILAEWEAFALTLQPASETATALALRNHAREILQAIARDMENTQTGVRPSDKFQGWDPELDGKETAAATHGALRLLVGFDIRQLTAEVGPNHPATTLQPPPKRPMAANPVEWPCFAMSHRATTAANRAMYRS